MSSRSCLARLRHPSKAALWRSSGVGWGRRVRVSVGVAAFDGHDGEVPVINGAGLCLWDGAGNDGVEDREQENKHWDERRHEEIGSDGHCGTFDGGLSWTRGFWTRGC